jgi:heme oxygenase
MSAAVMSIRARARLEGAESPGRAPLSMRLEEGTAATRREAEQTLFMRGLFQGMWGSSLYGQLVQGRHYVTYLQCLLEVYEALEGALAKLRGHPVVGGLFLPELWRSRAIQEDLRCFVGEAWRDAPRPVHLTALHVERIQQLSVVAPHLLVAHAYVRYAREVRTGPLLESMVARAFELSEGEGTSLYQAVDAASLVTLQLRVNRSLDALPLTEAGVREVVQEARLGFRLDTLLLDALARGAVGPALSAV